MRYTMRDNDPKVNSFFLFIYFFDATVNTTRWSSDVSFRILLLLLLLLFLFVLKFHTLNKDLRFTEKHIFLLRAVPFFSQTKREKMSSCETVLYRFSYHFFFFWRTKINKFTRETHQLPNKLKMQCFRATDTTKWRIQSQTNSSVR